MTLRLAYSNQGRRLDELTGRKLEMLRAKLPTPQSSLASKAAHLERLDPGAARVVEVMIDCAIRRRLASLK
jgi:hypothetical protein